MWLLIFSLAWAFDEDAIYRADQPPAPKAECLGNAGDPVKAIYLHGLFKAEGRFETMPDGRFKELEYANREKLKKFAEENHIRIALPLSAGVSIHGSQRWDKTGDAMASIKKSAQEACKVSQGELDKSLKCVMGFSRGANQLRDMASRSCDQFENRRVIAFGTDYLKDIETGVANPMERPDVPIVNCDGNFRTVKTDHDKFIDPCNLGQLCGLEPAPSCRGSGISREAGARR